MEHQSERGCTYHKSGMAQGMRWQYRMVGPQLKKVRCKALQAVVYSTLKSDCQHLHLMAGCPAWEAVAWIVSKVSCVQHLGAVQIPCLRMVGRLGNDKHLTSGQLPEQAAFLLMT